MHIAAGAPAAESTVLGHRSVELDLVVWVANMTAVAEHKLAAVAAERLWHLV